METTPSRNFEKGVIKNKKKELYWTRNGVKRRLGNRWEN